MQSTINRIPVHTITCSSTAEVKKQIAALRTQMAKLPPLASGKKRSFACSGLTITITEPVWNELASLQVRQEVTQQLIAEIENAPQPVVNAPAESPALQEAEKALQELATLRLPEQPGDDEPTPDLSKASVKQLKELCIGKGLRYPCRATKSLLISILTK